MWLGVLIDDDAGHVTLCAWGHPADEAIRITGPPQGMEQCVRVLQATERFGARFALPRCPSCGAGLGVPDIDAALA